MAGHKLNYCGELVRKTDPDRFLLSLLRPPRQRPALWALFAFNHEIAKTREVVTETQLGLIRLQWWRDALGNFYTNGNIIQHEVFQALAPAIREHDLAREDFETLIYAREFDLEDRQPANIEGVENYADFTTTPLNRMALRVLGEQAPEADLKAVSVAYAVTGLIRAIPFHAAQGRCYLPADKINCYDIKKMEKRQQLAALLEVLAGRTEEKIAGVSSGRGYLQSSLKLTACYLKKLRKVHFDPFDKQLGFPPLKFMLPAFLGRY